MTCTSDFEPRFQAQNPAISGDKYGWENCAAYAGAEAASYSTCGAVNVTGAQVRASTNEPIPDPASPGLNIIQVTDALAKFGVTVTPFTRMSWADVTALRAQGHAFSLCGQYSVLRTTKFSGDPNFYGGHQVYYPPSGKTQDPLCDGRRAGIYKYHGEVYPDDLMERFCGAFRVLVAGHETDIGIGWAQGFYTTSHPAGVPTPEPPEESSVRITATVYQQWTANGNDGVLRSSPIRAKAPFVRLPAGTVVTTRAEADDPQGNSWRLLDYPAGTRNPAWLLRYGPGVPANHDFIAGPIVKDPIP